MNRGRVEEEEETEQQYSSKSTLDSPLLKKQRSPSGKRKTLTFV